MRVPRALSTIHAGVAIPSRARPAPSTNSGEVSNRKASQRQRHSGHADAERASHYNARTAEIASAITSPAAGAGRLRREHQPVREHRLGERLDVVGERVVATLQHRVGHGGAQQQSPARGLAPSSMRGSTRVADRSDHVAAERPVARTRAVGSWAASTSPAVATGASVEHAVTRP